MVLVPTAAWKYQIEGGLVTRPDPNCQVRNLTYKTALEMEQEERRINWRSPEDIVEIAFRRSSVVMINEAHNGLKRCVRTRRIGQRILPIAHQAGVRHLAMEALNPTFAEEGNHSRVVSDYEEGYLSQPEMRLFIQAALDLGWTLIPYEATPFLWLSSKYGINLPNTTDMHEISTYLQPYRADLVSPDFTNWREEQQARNLIAALRSMPGDTPLLVWCGNGHNLKEVLEDWNPMGYCFQQLSGLDPFAIDQLRTVNFEWEDHELEMKLLQQYPDELTQHGKTMGFLKEEIPSSLAHYQMMALDAFLLSTENKME